VFSFFFINEILFSIGIFFLNIKAGRWVFFLGGVYYGYSKLQSLRAYDEPLRKAAIEKATREHHHQLLDKEQQNKGQLSLDIF
jgi:hypothetical protein